MRGQYKNEEVVEVNGSKRVYATEEFKLFYEPYGYRVSFNYSTANNPYGFHYKIGGSFIIGFPPILGMTGEEALIHVNGFMQGYTSTWITGNAEFHMSAIDADLECTFDGTSELYLTLTTLTKTNIFYPDDGTAGEGWQGTISQEGRCVLTFPEGNDRGFYINVYAQGNDYLLWRWYYEYQE